MSGQPVRIKPDTKERLFKFIEGKTVKRQRGRGSMKAGEGVELLLDSYYENVFIRKCFVLQHKISCCVLNFINPWNPKKAIDIRAAEINAIGSPFKASGTFALSNLSLIPANKTIAYIYPREAPTPFTILSIKL